MESMALNSLSNNSSSCVRKLLIQAHKEHLKFRVIIIDSRPFHEGKTLLKSLVSAGIHCTYGHLNSLSHLIKDVTKVFIGAQGMLSNGAVLSRIGTALVAMSARQLQLPVIVCCETYKFSDRVQLDSFVHNELGNPDDLVNISSYLPPSMCVYGKGGSVNNAPLEGWKDNPDLKLLHLMYDVTPCEFVTMIITEIGLIPASSVPVVIREGVKANASAHSQAIHE
jgi:translation initiation factor eIF-2B subunit delta